MRCVSTCVRSAMLHGGDTWAPNVSDLQHLRRNDRAMIRWICNTKLTDNLSTDLLLQRLGIYCIEECMHLQRLRWYGMSEEPVDVLTRSLTWLFPVLVNREDNPLDRETWRRKIKDRLELPTPNCQLRMQGQRQHHKHQN